MGFFRDRAVPIFLSVLVHAAVIGLLVAGVLKFAGSPKPQPKPQLAIEAEVVDEDRIAQEMRKLEEDEQRAAREREREQERAEELKREAEAEEQRLEQLRQERAAEEQAQVERQRVAEEEAKRKAEADKKAAADKKRKEEATRKKAAEEARQKAEREAQLKRQVAEEEARSAAVSAGLLAQYIAQIQARIQRAWIRPPSARAGLRCVVYVTQVPGGEVVSVRVGECNGDEIVRQSIEAAVYRASPLPEPQDPALFERNLRLEFKPDE
jgi:colicin import membrane protein